MTAASRPSLVEDLAAPVYVTGVGGAVLGAALPALYALRRGQAPGLMPVTTGAVLGELGGNVLGGGYGLYRRSRAEQPTPAAPSFAKRSNYLARSVGAGALLDLLLGGDYERPLSGALIPAVGGTTLSALLAPQPGLAAARAAAPTAAALGAGIGASRLLRRAYHRRKQSGALGSSYTVTYLLPDSETAEGTVRLPLNKIPLLRKLLAPKVDAYGGVTRQEIIDAALAGGADIPGGPIRTLTGFETIHGYRPVTLSVSKTSAARVWYRLRSA